MQLYAIDLRRARHDAFVRRFRVGKRREEGQNRKPAE